MNMMGMRWVKIVLLLRYIVMRCIKMQSHDPHHAKLWVHVNKAGPYTECAESVSILLPLHLCQAKRDELVLSVEGDDAGDGGVSLVH